MNDVLEKELAFLNEAGVKGRPTWEIALLFPIQGQWDEEEYLALETNRQVEFEDGVLEVLPIPTTWHQSILVALLVALKSFGDANKLGTTLPAALPVRVRANKYREPDIVFMRTKNRHRIHERYWDGADLVMEVVSEDPKDQKRDLVEKRRDYARAGIPEYWIVNPWEKAISVLTLKDKKYRVHGKYQSGDQAASHLLAGFSVDVDTIFAAP